MESVITGLVSRFGYWGVLLLIAVENIFPPIPSEVILTFGGFLTTCTEMTPPGVILFSTLGSVAGAIVLYGVGRLLAPQRLEALLSGRVGRVLKMESADVHKASDWFAAHGWPSVFYCRCIPILRSLISIPEGMAGMHPAPFLLLTTVGSLLWNILLVYLGALAGQSWPAVTAALGDIPYHLLGDYPEIVHGDLTPVLPAEQPAQAAGGRQGRIAVFDRGGQFDILRNVPGSYMWVSPVPFEILAQQELVQKPCRSASRYRDVLVRRRPGALSAAEVAFINELRREIAGLVQT